MSLNVSLDEPRFVLKKLSLICLTVLTRELLLSVSVYSDELMSGCQHIV